MNAAFERSVVLGADASLYEALFRVEPPVGEIAQALRAVGIDPTQLPARTEGQQWAQTVEVYRQQLYPALHPVDGVRMLGWRLAAAYAETLTGRLVLTTLSMVSPMQFLRRWPRFVRMGRTDVEIFVTELSERSALIHSRDPAEVPVEMNDGILGFCFDRMGHRVTARHVRLGPGEWNVTFSW